MSVRQTLVGGRGINDAVNELRSAGGMPKEYLAWVVIMNSEETVCPEWLSFRKFRTWYLENKVEGMSVSLLGQTKEGYRPDTTFFASSEVCGSFIKAHRKNSTLPLGVFYHTASKKYAVNRRSKCNQQKTSHWKTVEEAEAAYKKYKLETAFILAAKQVNLKLRERIITLAKELYT